MASAEMVGTQIAAMLELKIPEKSRSWAAAACFALLSSDCLRPETYDRKRPLSFFAVLPKETDAARTIWLQNGMDRSSEHQSQGRN